MADDIQIETNEISAVVREIEIEVAGTRVDKAFGRVVNELRKTARVKGFRPGKVPANVIKQMYGEGLAGEIERQLVRETLADAVELAELEPVVEPQIEAEVPSEGKAFRYKARIEIKPEIELPELSALSGERPKVEVGDDELLTELESLRERGTNWVEEDEEVLLRPAAVHLLQGPLAQHPPPAQGPAQLGAAAEQFVELARARVAGRGRVRLRFVGLQRRRQGRERRAQDGADDARLRRLLLRPAR